MTFSCRTFYNNNTCSWPIYSIIFNIGSSPCVKTAHWISLPFDVSQYIEKMAKKPAGDRGDIQFHINGVKHTVWEKYSPTTTLSDYIRDVAGLKGTKVMCKEDGCGSCAVTVTHAPDGGRMETMSIHSCLCPLYSVDGWQITTTEGIGSSKEGFHPIQERMAKNYASQCGYCTPGFVMSLYGLLHQDPRPSQQEIEDSLDGHMCRCTGYRPVLDAMKTFSSDSTSPNAKCIDIEDLNKKLCPKTGEPCHKDKDKAQKRSGAAAVAKRETDSSPGSLAIDLNGIRWYRPANLKDLAQLLQQHKTHSVNMVFGNTAAGIFKNQGPFEVYIDLRALKELYLYKENNMSVTFGAGTTITKMKERLKKLQSQPGYHYCAGVLRHLRVFGSLLLRNAGSIGGNLMMKHAEPFFPSDLFTFLEAIGCNVEILDSKTGKSSKHSLMDFLRKVDMKLKVIVAVEMLKWEAKDHYRSFKITPRWQNSHGHINAAFKISVDERKVIGKPNFVFGGVNSQTVHATKAENFIKNKTMSDEVINETLKIAYSELEPVAVPLFASPKYRRELAVNLLYKTLLEVYKPTKYSLQSGAASMERPLSSGLQTFQEITEDFPLRKPMPKKTAILQAAGEAEYVNDMPSFQHELSAALVVSDIACGKIQTVDPSAAMRIPGVVGFLSASDLPKEGQNNYIPKYPTFGGWSEELFATKDIEYAGQPFGLILAETRTIATEAARKVKVSYSEIKPHILDLETAIERNSIFKSATTETVKGDPEAGMKDAQYIVEGQIRQGTQYHYYIENQAALSVPSEDGIDIYATNQWADMVQKAVAQVLGKPMNYLNVTTLRLGGSFGGKLLQGFAVAASSALAAQITGRPVRLVVDLSTDMKFNSKRFPIMAKYKAGCDMDGKLTFIQVDVYIDSGCRATPWTFDLVHLLDQGFYCPNWKIKMMHMRTNKPTAGACRGPGSVPASLIIETIMEHLAKVTKQHPIMFKEINLYHKGQTDIEDTELTYCSIRELWQRLKQTAAVNSRINDVSRFNKNNQWRKRGITMCAVKYAMGWYPGGFPTHVSIFAGDGTVTVMTSGVEMGQGLYTKVAQAVARTLKVPLENVKVRPNQNNVCANALFTGASTTSERCVASAINACNILNERLQPLREKMPDADWSTLLDAAMFSKVEMQANSTQFNPHPKPMVYFTYLAGVVETEVDVLTGEFQIRRVDIMADFGESLNPAIDIGQIEGAFVMGLGAYLLENVVYDKETGVVLNDGTWEYNPPTTKDIPIDWRIHLLPDAPNPVGILSSKAVGEPAIGLAVGALLSIKSGVEWVREELTGRKEFLPVSAPFGVEDIQQAAGIKVDHLRVGGQS